MVHFFPTFAKMCALSQTTGTSSPPMSSTILIRTGLLLIPVSLVPLCQLIPILSSGSDFGTVAARFIAGCIPVLFAVAASMTEPNNSRSWQIISTVIVFFTLKYMLSIFAPSLTGSDLICAFFSAVITATFSSHITANTLHLKRYLQSRFLNFGILLICCVAAVILISCARTVYHALFSLKGNSGLITSLPAGVRVAVCALAEHMAAPFGLNRLPGELLLSDPGTAATANLQGRMLFHRYCTSAFFIPAMLAALCLRLSSGRRTPVIFMILIAVVTSFFPHQDVYILLTLIWLWPGLFLLHLVLSALLAMVTVLVPELAGVAPPEIYTRLINPVVAAGSAQSASYLYMAGGAVFYFLMTLILLSWAGIGRLSWKIKKHRNVRIRLISDRKGSSDLSLLAIRTMKIAGGLDNFRWIKCSGKELRIGYRRTDMVNLDALKGVGTDSRIDTDSRTISIQTSSPEIAEGVSSKIIIFAEREFSDLTAQEGEHHAMDTD